MNERVFVKVIGFTDVERHALNTVFRLSEQGPVPYALWMPDAPAAAKLLLVDEQSYEASLVTQSIAHQPEQKLIWIGAAPPPEAARVFERPLNWPLVVQAMDGLLGVADELDFDLDIGGDTGPDTQPPDPNEVPRRALIISPDRDVRLYLRARLALAALPLADEAVSHTQVMERIQAQPYAVSVLDADLTGIETWTLVGLIRRYQVQGRVIVIKRGLSLMDRWQARRAGADTCLNAPIHPSQLQQALERGL